MFDQLKTAVSLHGPNAGEVPCLIHGCWLPVSWTPKISRVHRDLNSDLFQVFNHYNSLYTCICGRMVD